MAVVKSYNLGGLNLYVNPYLRNDGEFIQLTNVDVYPYGAISKRSGVTTFLGTANGSAVTNLFSWTKNDGSLYVYRVSGGVLYYSVEGTGAWSIAGNGTVHATNYVGYSVLDNTMIICDGSGSTRHTTSGTSFTNTTGAPVAVDAVQYQNRIHLLGTSSSDFYSVANDATNWSGTGAFDSSSLAIPGGGKLKKGFVAGDRLVLNKTSGKQFKWDGYALVDTGTELGVTSPWSVDEAEGYYFGLNRLGVFGYSGAKPQILSNAVQPQIYNILGSGVAGNSFDSSGGGVHRYRYYLGLGTTTDDYSNTTISDNVLVYDYQTNTYVNHTYAAFPKVFHSFINSSKNETMLMAGGDGQVYQISGTAVSDNGTPIKSNIEFVIHGGVPERDKKFSSMKLFFNPGCSANVQYALSEHFVKGDSLKEWRDAGDAHTGICEIQFPSEYNRNKFLYVKIYDSSTTARFTYYGYSYDAEVVGHP